MNAIWMWTEGVDHGLVWDGGAAVLDGEVPLGSAVRLWSALDKGAGLGEFLEELSRELEVTLLSLPAFAIGLRRDDGWQLAARGTLEIVIDGSEVVQGRALSTWTERTVTRVTSLSLGRSEAPADSARRPVVAGLVATAGVGWPGRDPADSSVEVGAASVRADRIGVPADAGQSPADDAGPIVAVPRGAVPVTPGVDEPPVDEVGFIASVPAAEVPTDYDVVEARAKDTLLEDDSQFAEGLVQDEDPEMPAPGKPARESTEHPAGEGDGAKSAGAASDARLGTEDEGGEPDDSGQSSRFERMFGATYRSSVEEAAVREPDAESAVISGVPGQNAVTPPAGEPDAAAPSDFADHDGHTVLAHGDAVVNFGGPAGFDVLAVDCARGHANPPQRPQCGLCGAPVNGVPHRVLRPELGVVRLPDGERAPLMQAILVGRRPDPVKAGLPDARVVPVAQGHVSSNHLELRLEEWNVLAVDLRSTNGTYLRRRNQPPVRLGERPELLIAGDVLDLGHGVQIVVEELR